MGIEVLDSVNDPGTPGKSGDDRLGFDAAAGRAWVIDGATDATDLKPFPSAESGAAWLAETVSHRLMSAPEAGEAAEAYFSRVLTDVAGEAARVSKTPLQSLPGEALPVASCMWMRRDGEACEFVWAGDCFAIAETASGAQLIGTQEKADAETREAARMLALPQAERWAILQAQRRAANAPERGLITLNPATAAHLNTARLTLAPGAGVLLMTDGFFRFIEPYALETPASLLARVMKDGLPAALNALRQHEVTPHTVRMKARDDAAAVLVRV
ncbi:MAG: protein phosphatase 2C domain-containing protein [Hyphomonas sp.]